MALVICRECKAQTSTLATACLRCGARKSKKPGYAIVVTAFFGLTLLANTWLLWRLYEVESRAADLNIAGVGTNPR